MTAATPVSTTVSISHVQSDGAWTLALKRFARDKVGVFALCVLLGFVLLASLSAWGFIAADWQVQKAIGYAPPKWLGQSAKSNPLPLSSITSDAQKVTQPNEYDLLASTLNELRGNSIAADATAQRDAQHGIVDPLATTLVQLKSELTKASVADSSAQLATTLPLGADKWGRDVLAKVLKGTQVSLFVGLTSALLATLIGTVFGAFAGYYGGKTDLFFNWIYSVFNAIPNILLVLAIAAVLQSKGVGTVIMILGLTGWSSVFRLVRAEYLKHRGRDYVRAAQAIGASDTRKMFIHILPNISHVILVNLSLLVVLFIKSEVILSFLGFGVPVDTVSWGSMLNEAQNELILGYWWQLLAATLFMAVLVTAFSLFTDALRDALDPKLK
jgi:peptide/nickel transport system permease protein